MKNSGIRLGIVDDHQIVIDGLKSLLHGHDRFEVLIESTLPSQMLELLEKKTIDILLTDVMMPIMNGAELARAVHQKFPSIKILALSMSGQGELVNQMIEDADISGYVLKNIGKKELSNKQIAEKLFLSERTVETHRKNIFRKTNTASVIGLVKYAYEHKLI